MRGSQKKKVCFTFTVNATFANAIEQIAFEHSIVGATNAIAKAFQILNTQNSVESVVCSVSTGKAT